MDYFICSFMHERVSSSSASLPLSLSTWIPSIVSLLLPCNASLDFRIRFFGRQIKCKVTLTMPRTLLPSDPLPRLLFLVQHAYAAYAACQLLHYLPTFRLYTALAPLCIVLARHGPRKSTQIKRILNYLRFNHSARKRS